MPAPTPVAPATTASNGQKVLRFTREKETKNTIKFEEQPEPGQPPIVGSLYLQKWFIGSATSVRVAITKE
jgi:hypothetical protein